MPSDQEKLAIAEEKARIAKMMFLNHKLRCKYVAEVDGIVVDKDGDYFAYRKDKFQNSDRALANHTDPVECAYLALQKLAAEKEAARTTEERRLAAECERLRKALEEISDCGLSTHSDRADKQKDIARKALEGA